jgi:N-acetylmuramoyl-L-alanine amidase
MKILIDNGHGIETPGKRSPDGRLREYRYTREIAAAVVSGLERKGIDAIRLVPEETDIPLKERVRRANAYGQDSILVSIHCNAAGHGDRWYNARGWCAFTTPGPTRADALATAFYNAAQAHLPGMRLRTDYTDGDPDQEAAFYLLRHTNCPAVLTENLFMDNHADCNFLLSKEGQQTLVDLHVDGICAYLENS